jgi:hypothetical protein
MVEGAGVQPEPLDRPRPCEIKRVLHQPTAGTSADEFCGDAERPDFASRRLAEIQFEQPLVGTVGDQRISLDQRMMQPCGKLVVCAVDAIEPQPLLIIRDRDRDTRRGRAGRPYAASKGLRAPAARGVPSFRDA